MFDVLSSVFDSTNWATSLLCLVLCAAVLLYVQWYHWQSGPVGLPYLGYYPFLRDDYHLQLAKMNKKYGEVYLFSCTGQIYVHLGSLSALKEAHITKSDCFGRRTTKPCLFQETFGEGVGFSNDEKWKELRKFFVQALKEYGLGRKSQEGLLGNDLQKIVEMFGQSEQRDIDALGFFTDVCTRSALKLLIGATNIDSDDVHIFTKNYHYMMTIMTDKLALTIGPLYKYILSKIHPKLRKYRKYNAEVESVFLKLIRQREKEFSKDDIKDLVDCFINERKRLEMKGDPKSKIYTDSTLVSTIVQFLGDGSLSPAYLTATILKSLSCHPDIQKEIQRELDEAVGTNRLPSWDDRNRTPYTNAVIYEITRTCNFFATFPSQECTKETTIRGCHIPKGAITLVNFWAATQDPAFYEEPEKFDPTRYLPNKEGKLKSELPVIFGVGRRSCIGEPLISMEVFLFVTTVLQNFTLHPAKDDDAVTRVHETDYSDESMMIRATPRTA